MTRKRGFTLIELLIVITIIAILTVLAIWSITSNLAKSRDSKRKSDLDRIKIAFEDYYADNNAYPPPDILTACGDDAFKPYLGIIPCDPRTKLAYCYIYDEDGGGQNYRLLSSLEHLDDPIIAKLSCDEDPTYCGYEDVCSALGRRFNYGVSSGNIIVNNENIGSGGVGGTPTPTPSPTATPGPLPSTIPGTYACTPFGNCDNYSGNPNLSDCPLTFSNSSECNAYCATSPIYARCPAQ